jgi:hypothetical protein
MSPEDIKPVKLKEPFTAAPVAAREFELKPPGGVKPQGPPARPGREAAETKITPSKPVTIEEESKPVPGKKKKGS